MSVEEVARGVGKAAEALPFDLLTTASTLLDEAVTALDVAVGASNDSEVARALVREHRCRSEIIEVFHTCARVHTMCQDYLVAIGAQPLADHAPTAPSLTDPAMAAPLHPHLEEHVFRGHVRYRRITGYHSRPDGADSGPISVSERGAPDVAGCYWARATATTRSGRQDTRRKTFFPDDWSEAEVRQAIRVAFRTRRRTFGDDGAPHPTVWRSTYRGLTIEGMVFPSVDIATADLDDVGTAYPVYRYFPEEPDHDG